MSRYGSGSGRKSTKSTLLVPMLISFFVGIAGIVYVYNNYRHKIQQTGDFFEGKAAQATESKAFNDVERQDTTVDLALKEPVKLEAVPQIEPEAKIEAQPEQPSTANQPALPDLLGSDPVVRQVLVKLSPGLATWLNTDQLVRRLFLIVNDFSQNQRVTSHMSFLRLQDAFFVEQENNDLYIAAKNYQRYKPFTQAIAAIDAKKAANHYLRFRPLLLQVFSELGYPKDITLESLIKKAAGEIIAAPIIEGRIMLIRPSVYYRFADPKMEAFNPVQKQMLRMGPENTRIMQAKCREFLVELGKLDIK